MKRPRPRHNPITTPDGAVNVYALMVRGALAAGCMTKDGFVVLSGSIAREDVSRSLSTNWRRERSRLIRTGQLRHVPRLNAYRFERDVTFTSPSMAAAIVVGRSASGPAEWKRMGDGYLRDGHASNGPRVRATPSKRPAANGNGAIAHL